MEWQSPVQAEVKCDPYVVNDCYNMAFFDELDASTAAAIAAKAASTAVQSATASNNESSFSHLGAGSAPYLLGYPETPGGQSAFGLSNRTPRGCGISLFMPIGWWEPHDQN